MGDPHESMERECHQKFAVDLFNMVWALMDKGERTEGEQDKMIHAAHASRYHWGEVGEPKNLAIGEWQVSRVYTVVARAEPALFHARRCLRICEENGLDDFPLAYAYEALARASALAGRAGDRDRFMDLGRRAGEGIQEKDDRELFFRDLGSVPVNR